MTKTVEFVQLPSKLLRRAESDTTWPSNTSQPSRSGSFIGNTPSTVLFFIALAVGICIALLFIFFTLRYFIKTKFGVYIPAHSYGMRFDPATAAGRTAFRGGVPALNHFNDFADYALHRDYNMLLAANERRFQRRRYHKKRKLTKDEVDELFPTKTYNNWINGGKEDDYERQKGLILHENELEDVNQQHESEIEVIDVVNPKDTQLVIAQSISATEADITELANTSSSKHVVVENIEEKTSSGADHEMDLTDELHYSSGMCAICLDTLDDEDLVRGLICGHVFHQECIDPWLISRKACCPMCKRDYYMKDQDAENGTDGDSLRLLDSISELIYPRPIAYRARELLEALDAETARNAPAADDNESSPAGQSGDSETLRAASPIENRISDDTDITLEDLVGIRELALLALPSYCRLYQRIFWRLMGITKQNLTDYLVVRIYEERRRNRMDRVYRETRALREAHLAETDNIEMRDANVNVNTEQEPLTHNTDVRRDEALESV